MLPRSPVVLVSLRFSVFGNLIFWGLRPLESGQRHGGQRFLRLVKGCRCFTRLLCNGPLYFQVQRVCLFPALLYPGLATMRIGMGQGIATVIERVGQYPLRV
jgi:hypothetical protein